MKMPAPYWTMTYSASRRAHHHRCRGCNRIIQDGEPVLMAQVVARGRSGSKTASIHATCADRPSFGGYTEREYLEAHGMAYLAACGWREAERFMSTAPINKPGEKVAHSN
ncbi:MULTISPECIES: hypothetical protein [unclassified Xanthobacter]|uniref:hypothetical protein n=1 Tax=unclassified Xanthobacter TaxID=2623496 RepID=UPI001F3AB4D5|nr:MULTISPECIES: hypothetical protein [unclassified Xanthobacter]